MQVTAQVQKANVQLTPHVYFEDDDGVWRDTALVCLVVMNSILGRGYWFTAGFARIRVIMKDVAALSVLLNTTHRNPAGTDLQCLMNRYLSSIALLESSNYFDQACHPCHPVPHQ